MLLASESQFWVGKMVGMYLEQFPGDPTPTGPTGPIPSAETPQKRLSLHHSRAQLIQRPAPRPLRRNLGLHYGGTTSTVVRRKSNLPRSCQRLAKVRQGTSRDAELVSPDLLLIASVLAVGPSLTSSAAVSAEPRELVATPWTIFFVDLLVLLFLILPVPMWLPASVVGFAVGLG